MGLNIRNQIRYSNHNMNPASFSFKHLSRIKFIKPLYTKGLNVRNSEARALGRISIRKDVLELNNAGIEDSGNYSCKVKAWQTDEYDSITYTLTVLGK
jgi:hypothetical protein